MSNIQRKPAQPPSAVRQWLLGIIRDLESSQRTRRSLILNNVNYIIFIAFLAVIYIANARFAEKNIRQLNTLKKEIKELRWEYMTSQSELMVKSKQTEVGKLVDPIGLQTIDEPPKKIAVPKPN